MPAVVLRPHFGESLSGFVARFAAANELGATSWVWSVVGSSSSSLVGDHPSVGVFMSRCRKLARVLGVSVDEVRQLAIGPPRDLHHGLREVLGQMVHGLDVSSTLIRFCPVCLDKNGFHRVEWQLRFVVACPEHGNLLAGRCPYCGVAPQALARGGMHCNRCYRDWRQVRCAPAAESTIAFAANVKVRLTDCSAQVLLPITSASEFIDARDLLAAMRGVLRLLGLAPADWRNVDWRDCGEAQSMASRAYDVLQNWPHALFSELDEMWQLGGREPLTSKSAFYRNALLSVYRMPANSSTTLVAAMDEYICNHWPRMSGMPPSGAAIRRRHHLREGRWLIGSEVASRMGVSIRVLSDLIRRGVIPAARAGIGEQQETWLISAAVAEEVERAWSRNHRQPIYYRHLGIVEKDVQKKALRELGVLVNSDGQRFLDPALKYVSIDAIGRFLLNVEMSRSRASRGVGQLVSLQEILEALRPHELCRLKERLESGGLELMIGGPSVSSWLVREDDLNHLLDGTVPLRIRDGLSVKEIARAFGFSALFVRHWRGQQARGAIYRKGKIGWGGIERLLAEFISLQEVQAVSGMGDLALLERLSEYGIQPLKEHVRPPVFLRTVFNLLYRGPRPKSLPFLASHQRPVRDADIQTTI